MKIKAKWGYAPTGSEPEEGYIISFVGDADNGLAVFVSLEGRLRVEPVGRFRVDMTTAFWNKESNQA